MDTVVAFLALILSIPSFVSVVYQGFIKYEERRINDKRNQLLSKAISFVEKYLVSSLEVQNSIPATFVYPISYRNYKLICAVGHFLADNTESGLYNELIKEDNPDDALNLFKKEYYDKLLLKNYEGRIDLMIPEKWSYKYIVDFYRKDYKRNKSPYYSAK